VPASRVAIVHDYLNQYGGAERVLEVLHDLYPEAPVYTSIYWPEQMSAAIRAMDVRTSFMQRLPGVLQHHQRYVAFYPFAFRQFDLSGYDLVISNSSAFAKGVRRPPGARHVCYCLTPMRWVWSFQAYVEREQLGRVARAALPPVIRWLRWWDVANSRGVDRFMAISRAVQGRIKRYYGRESEIVYPPIDTAGLTPRPGPPDDYYVVISRLLGYKRVDLAIDACNRLGRRLKIAGTNLRLEPVLRERAGPTVEFLGRASDAERAELYARCRASIAAGEDDFGLTPIEVNAAGRPAIAYAAGGALDTVVDGETGVLFHEQTVDAVAAAIERCESIAWDPARLRANAERFGEDVFRRRFVATVDAAMMRA
jgi:glycosyltransferase involved in cell wall biosynthesis